MGKPLGMEEAPAWFGGKLSSPSKWQRWTGEKQHHFPHRLLYISIVFSGVGEVIFPGNTLKDPPRSESLS